MTAAGPALDLPHAVLTPGTGLEPDDHVLGPADAPVTVLEYGDFECPYCAAAAPVLHQLVDESDGRVRLVFRHFPLAQMHPYALTAALAAEAAGAQGSFWPMHDLIFARQDQLTDPALQAYAEELGLDPGQVVGDAAQRFGDKVEADFAAGLLAGVPGTPTLFVNGRMFSGRVEIGALRRAVGLAGDAGSVDPAAAGANSGSRGDGRGAPRPRRQHRWSFGLRRAEGEPVAEEPQQCYSEDRGDH
jgi:predicted DsbA family dithiol-disulfide isomerase